MEIDISGAVQGFVQDVEKQVASRAERAAHVIRKYELSVLSNNPKRSGKVYRKPASNKTYTASAPGEPPALRTGDLRRSFRPLAKSEIVQSARHPHRCEVCAVPGRWNQQNFPAPLRGGDQAEGLPRGEGYF